MKRIYMFVGSTCDESIYIDGIFDSLEKALEHKKSGGCCDGHLIACNIGYPMDLRYLSDYSEICEKSIKKELEYLKEGEE